MDSNILHQLEKKDSYTMGHCVRVASFSRRLGENIGLDKLSLDVLERGALLHDIGKLGIPDAILKKDSKLTDEEFAFIKKHPQMGIDIIGGQQDDEIISIILHHHERFDGRGYPAKLSGENIPLFARIVAVADSFDAMTSHRAYRQNLTFDQALAELERCAGSQFDPVLVKAFKSVINS